MTEPLEQRNLNPDTTATMPDTSLPESGEHDSRARGLLAIGVFKLSKAVFFFGLGIGALHLVHKNIGDVLLRVATILHFDPEGQFVGMLEDKADLISGHQLRTVSELSILYSMVALTEGIGLMMQKTWAEYLTLILTIGALPWELFELIKRPTPIHVGLLLVNLAVLAYLLWFLRWHRRRRSHSCQTSG
ncbi:MAG: DUF2127 domain-containing protein [Acidobacteriota bacterium]|nr:DUF2127 domain-containing protein [Acidobacteriota bacterium]